MASGTKSKGSSTKNRGKGAKAARASVVASKPKPWGTILAVVFIVLLAGGVFGYIYVYTNEQTKFVVSEDNKDPSENIGDVTRVSYEPGKHVKPEQRVAYDQTPAFGGPHDQVWADCSGTVYDKAVRSENMVHSLEHGAIWIAYNPDRVSGGELDKLKGKVEGQPDMMLSPYPGLDRPISLQSWGHQLKLDSADDARIDQFIKSLKRNQYQNPEPRGSCDGAQAGFDLTNPPPFVAEKPGEGAVTMDGKGAIDESAAEQSGQAPLPPNPVPPSDPNAPPAGSQPPPSQ